ncbi:nitrilase-related carbon-nitrogen hydrolase [Dactylosporangium sp. AC04546]|uniref:nitrilase-related carbon-nitrogen hydrolase n=1 Tax=Dactylosporangium sp. AC04546 TaxID=2862460 RepID=UPI001EDF139D|nr:nitrilase-related carbon-nitrogen hydrolase [Dactylosporangium sp. AC04546]WVK86619.1 nitrilase-related carbon-nitrogen hydrolase [Dactylosporangium sp. AC04546]
MAVVQDAPVVFDRDATLDRVDKRAREAANGGAQLVLFPEAFVSGYPQDMTFGAVVGTRTPEGHEQYRRYWASAVDVPGPDVDRLGEIAARHRIVLVIGVVERSGGTLFCTVLFFGADGALQGRHRKLMPTAMERLVWGMGDGSTLPVIDTSLGRVGAVICWENYMPLMRAAMYAKGIEIYCAPTADDLDMWVTSVRHIAKEGRVFVLSSCQFLQRSDCPEDYEASHDRPVLVRGGSCIVAPTGDVIAGPVYDRSAVLLADLDLDDIPRAKYDLDVSGHYARPDVFQLAVDERAKVTVTFGTDND